MRKRIYTIKKLSISVRTYLGKSRVFKLKKYATFYSSSVFAFVLLVLFGFGVVSSAAAAFLGALLRIGFFAGAATFLRAGFFG